MPDINRKMHKLASAIYLITGFFSDQEPLKWKLRELSTELVSDSLKDKFHVAKEIMPLFTLAKNAGLVSETNHEIMTRELSRVEQEQEKGLDSMLQRDIHLAERVSPQPVKVEPVRDRLPEPKPMIKPAEKESGVVLAKKNSRQEVILDLLKHKKEIMIKDVSSLISGVSEKTIQRELLSMVSEGVLKKIGEKRWSRYSLA